MSKRRRIGRALALAVGLVLVLVLAGRVAGADGECHDNYPKPQPKPTPTGLVQKALWKEASLYADVKWRNGNLRYQACTFWRPE